MSLLTAAEVRQLRANDRELMRELEETFPQAKQRLRWRCREVQRAAKLVSAGEAGLAKFQKLARQRGLFDITLDRRTWRDSDGEQRVVTAVRAASTKIFPMGTHYYVRDNVTIGAMVGRLPSRAQRQAGKDLLLSGLTFMSSVAQLKRFEAIVRSTRSAWISNAQNWPKIFAAIEDNLTTHRDEVWAHKQDAWQMLAWYVFDALDQGLLSPADLTVKHRRFLASIVPFLAKIACWKAPNSGSWEELEAVRTSVRAWEHRLVVRIGELASSPGYTFLQTGYMRMRRHLVARFQKVDLFGAVKILDRQLSSALLKDLPFECPMYPRSDARYRRGDAALIYLLQLDYAAFLASRTGRDQQWVRRMEQRLLEEIEALRDDWTGGIYRYKGDSFQRCGFFRAVTVAELVRLYGAPAGYTAEKFTARHYLVPRGRQAAWTHFVWQLAAWAGERFVTTKEVRYAKLHDTFFMRGLRLITGDEGSLDIDEAGKSRVVRIPKWRMPECYIADKTLSGKEMVFPSPHTPLNWSVGEMLNAFRVRSKVMAER